MPKLNESRTIHVRVKEGSALERLIEKSQLKTPADVLHEMAAAHEATSRNAGARRWDADGIEGSDR